MAGKKLLELLCLLWSVFCLTKCVRRNDAGRWRRGLCPDGTYTAQNQLECCLCPKGSYLKSDCTSNLSAPVCESCENGTYRDRANRETNCEPCMKCGIRDNKVEERACTVSSNTACRCEDNFYCDKESECKYCYLCSTCDEFGVKVACSLTNDAQCNTEAPAGPKVVLAIIIPIVIIAILIAVLLLLKKKRLCVNPLVEENPELMEPLEDPDLQDMLPKISEILGFRVVRMVVRHQAVLPQATIDNIMDENPRDASERAYQLLKAWYEKHGMRGASKALYDTLNDIHMKSKAEAVLNLIKKEQNNREVEKNGNV